MATKLPRKIPRNAQFSDPVQGQYTTLKYWNDRYHPGKSPLFYENNRKWRRINEKYFAQLISLDFHEIMKLIAPKDQEAIYEDFRDILDWHSEEKALNDLRQFLCANFIWLQLVKHKVDFSTPIKSKRPINLIIQLLKLLQEIKLHVKDLLKQLHQSNRFKIIRPAMLLPQRSPNAPNFLPALSLAVA